MTIQKLQTVTVIASAAISRNRFVGWTGAHSTSVDDVLGLSEAPAAIGGAVSVVTKYSAPVEAAGAINVGDYVAPANDGTGRAVAGNVINNCGRALVGASGVGSIAVVAVSGSERGGSVSGDGIVKATNRRLDRAIALEGGALIQAPAWAAATAYAVGDVVRLSTGPLLLCQTAGTSAGSAPTFNAGAAITDNTVTWNYLGRVSRLLPNREVPTITTSATAPAGSTVRAWNSGSGNVITAGLPISLPCGTSLVGVSNVYTVQDNFYNNGSTGVINGLAAGLNAIMQVVEFVTDDPAPAFGTWNNNSQPLCDVYVGDPSGDDMRLIEEHPTPMLSGNPCWYIISWGGVRKLRRYRLEIRNTGSGTFTNLYGLAYLATSTIYAPASEGARGIWISDSYTTTISPSLSSRQSNASRLGARALKLAGARYAQCIGQDGAGYVAGSATVGGSSSKVTVPLALSSNSGGLSAWQPDFVVFACGLNDTPYASQVQAAALSAFRTARSIWPNAFVAVFGLQNGPNNSGASAQTDLVRVFASKLADALGVPVTLQDERLSSREIEAHMQAMGGKKAWKASGLDRDSAAATLFLQLYLDRRALP